MPKFLLMATEKLLEATPQEVLTGWKLPKRHLLLRLEPQAGRIDLFGIWAPKHYRKTKDISYIAGPVRGFHGDAYNSWVKVAKAPVENDHIRP